ncbi:MarR family transcriptional regulator [Burkholderiaceae bacterium FT117]|uniref:MarR family winged helix-turn-helix transcriptional regulator n=1 Tax=Zeimonas sediminis TaxID=2944268 RepID=UPI002342E2CE|nr:MarR family transcriptional regulator [Zeimonas sediminis]MCM5571296.1 MarR family transcriptional regulator [Zeimonas sediminis]
MSRDTSRRTNRPAAAPPLDAMPGYHIRRLQQIAVAIFLEEAADFGITPVQYAALTAARERPGIDQRTLAGVIGFDPSTIGGVIGRLEKRGLVARRASPTDRRVRLVTLTSDGERLLAEVLPRVRAAQRRILAPLPAAERERFVAALRTLVEANNALSRAPRDPDA